MPINVFGIAFPLFEVMLIFIVLLTAGIIFIFIELKKLNDYLKIEREDLQRLERDIGALELEEQKLSAAQQRPSYPQQAVPQQQVRR